MQAKQHAETEQRYAVYFTKIDGPYFTGGTEYVTAKTAEEAETVAMAKLNPHGSATVEFQGTRRILLP